MTADCIIMIIFLVIIVAGMGWYIWFNINSNRESRELENKIKEIYYYKATAKNVANILSKKKDA